MVHNLYTIVSFTVSLKWPSYTIDYTVHYFTYLFHSIELSLTIITFRAYSYAWKLVLIKVTLGRLLFRRSARSLLLSAMLECSCTGDYAWALPLSQAHAQVGVQFHYIQHWGCD